MTIDEAIKREEELADGHDRIKQIKAVTLEECRRAEEHRQLVEWLKELQAYRNNLTNQSLSDALVYSENENERLHDIVNELSKELKAHREAWDKCIKEIKEWYWNSDKQAIAKDTCVVDSMIDLSIRTIKECRPKEGDAE